MKIKGLIALHHPDWSGTFIIKKHNLKSFIKKNDDLWQKYNIDPDIFIAENVWIKDNELEDILLDNLPELFL